MARFDRNAPSCSRRGLLAASRWRVASLPRCGGSIRANSISTRCIRRWRSAYGTFSSVEIVRISVERFRCPRDSPGDVAYSGPMDLVRWAAREAERRLSPLGPRWAHTQGVVARARALAVTVAPADRDLLI